MSVFLLAIVPQLIVSKTAKILAFSKHEKCSLKGGQFVPAQGGQFDRFLHFTREAMDYTPRNETKIVLIDGEQLAQQIIHYNLGCTTQQTYKLKEIDSDYFDED